jgi:hypothetical protein
LPQGGYGYAEKIGTIKTQSKKFVNASNSSSRAAAKGKKSRRELRRYVPQQNRDFGTGKLTVHSQAGNSFIESILPGNSR